MEYLAHQLGMILGSATKITITAGIIYIGYRLIQKLIEHRVNYERELDTAENSELEFYRTAAEIEQSMQREDKEKELLRKQNEILVHLIQDEHWEKDR